MKKHDHQIAILLTDWILSQQVHLEREAKHLEKKIKEVHESQKRLGLIYKKFESFLKKNMS